MRGGRVHRLLRGPRHPNKNHRAQTKTEIWIYTPLAQLHVFLKMLGAEAGKQITVQSFENYTSESV